LKTPVRTQFLGSEGNRLAADLWGGDGPVVVCFHGGGQTRRAWDDTAQRLVAEGMRAITVDMRGHGESEWVASGDYTFSANGEDVAAVIQQIIVTFGAAPSVVGASLGGISSLLAEIHHGPLLESLILVDVTPRMNSEGVRRVLGFMSQHAEQGFASLPEAAEVIATYLPRRPRPTSFEGLRKNLRHDPDGRYRWHWDPLMMTGEKNVNSGAPEILETLMAGVPTLRLPVLLVRGMQSELVDEAYAREFVAAAPCATYVDVSDAGHMVAGDKNDAFCAAILAFLKARYRPST
jgi:pimeloyl-ACP methyl ester carboxylesterase